MTWQKATVVGLRDETPAARTLVLKVVGWTGHQPGQHVDLRVTAADGYQASRSYSIASPSRGEELELTIERLVGGEVSPYLTHEASIGDHVEVLGPLGGWFVWRPEVGADMRPVQLIGGGSGVVPLMAMMRVHATLARARPAMRLLYSARDPSAVLYREEIERRGREQAGVDVSMVYTRYTPRGSPSTAQRINAASLEARVWPAEQQPQCFVCGPTGFVERVSGLLVDQGHAPTRIRTERFGPSGPGPLDRPLEP